MAKKEKKKIAIILLLLLLISVIFFSMQFGIEGNIDDQGVKLKVFGVKKGTGEIVQLSPAGTQSTVSFAGGPAVQGLSHIFIESTITLDNNNLPDGATINVNDFTGDLQGYAETVDRYDTAVQNYVPFNLQVGGSTSNVQTSEQIPIDAPLEDTVIPPGSYTFHLSVDYTYKDAAGNDVPGNAVGTVIVTITGDSCGDGTPWYTCSNDDGSGGDYCYEGPDLIDCGPGSSNPECEDSAGTPITCDCQPNYISIGGVCSEQLCSGTYNPGECTGSAAQMCDPNCLTEICTSIENCYECGQSGQTTGTPLGWVDQTTNAGACPDDYYGAPAVSCVDINQPDGCTYTAYSGGVTVDLTGNGEGGAPGGYVIFRTSGIDYSNVGWIAYYDEVCGSLTGYGRLGGTGIVGGSCSSYLDTVLLSGLTNTYYGDGSAYLGTINAFPDRLYVCFEDTGTSQHTSKYYTTSDPDALAADTTPTSVDPAREVGTC